MGNAARLRSDPRRFYDGLNHGDRRHGVRRRALETAQRLRMLLSSQVCPCSPLIQGLLHQRRVDASAETSPEQFRLLRWVHAKPDTKPERFHCPLEAL